MKIAIYCGSSFGNNKIYEQKAKDLIAYLAKKNTTIVYGGSKSGLMKTISEEAVKLNLEVHGVITTYLANKEIENKDITKLYKVSNIRERKAKMEELSEAFIALPGGFGTIEEIAEVFTSIQIRTHTKPCALYNVNGYFDKLISFLKHCIQEGFIQKNHFEAIIISDDIEYIYNSFLEYKAPKSKWD